MSQPNNDPTQQPQRGTFTVEEAATLQKYLPRFHQIKRTPGMKLPDFWELLEKNYFHAHPLRKLTEEEIARGVGQAYLLARVRKVSEVLCLFLAG